MKTTLVQDKEYSKASVTCLDDNFAGMGANNNLTQIPMVKMEEEYADLDEEKEIYRVFDEFVDKLGLGCVKKLLKDASNRSEYLNRTVDGGVDYQCELSRGEDVAMVDQVDNGSLEEGEVNGFDGPATGSKRKSKPQNNKKQQQQQKGQLMANVHGKMVAENAPEAGAGNVGHKMLTQMGWQPGQGLGATEQQGISAPVYAMIRAGRRGLGA